jgi:hypothetical protein
VLKTTTCQSRQLFGALLCISIVVAHTNPVGTFYYTRFSLKTQASFLKIHKVCAHFHNFGIETSPISTVDAHYKTTISKTNLVCSKTNATFGQHESVQA